MEDMELEENPIEVFFESYSHVEDSTHTMSVSNPSAMLYPDEAQSTAVSTDISVPEELSLSGKEMELHQDIEESKYSGKQTGSSQEDFGGTCPKEYSISMGTDEAIPGEKLGHCEKIEESRCSVIQMPEEKFRDVHPKDYCQDMGAEAIPSEKLEHCKDTGADKCSEIQIDLPKQHFGGARPKEYRRDMGSDPAVIPDQDDVPKKYYAVAFPTEEFIIKDDPLIFEQKKDALQAIQQNQGARFREFSSRSEALQYASIPYEPQTPSSPSEGNLMFKTLSEQELIHFQKCIEDGRVTYFLELVWSNPRHLIAENDYPTVIQEDSQTNALHIAAIHGQVRIFVQILYVLQDTQFMSILHPKDEPSKLQARIRCLVSFYLNMYDSGLCETPLHLACRFGYHDIVRIILAFSESFVKNKLDKGLRELICRNCHYCSPDHKRSILNLFEEMCYVPIVQDEVCKYVDKPCDAETVLAAMTTHPLKAGSPAIYCAFAGPAPYSIAKKLYFCLKSNKYVFLMRPPTNAVMASSQKRIEKDGRKLSKKYHIGWIEYWRSLDAWLDISSSVGLKFLEKHLNQQDIRINILPDEPPIFLDIIKNFIEEFVVKITELAVTCDKLSFFHELQTLVLFMDCFIKYPFSDEIKVLEIHEELGHILFLKLTEDNHKNIEKFHILKLLLLNQFSYVSCYQKSIWKMFCCVLRFASYFQQDSEFVVKPACQCNFPIVEDLYVYSSNSCYFKLLSWRQDITNELVQKHEAMFEKPLPEEKGLAEPLPEEKGLAEPFPEEKGLAEPLPEEKGLAVPLPEEKGLAEPLPEEKGLAVPLPEEKGLAEPLPEEKGLAVPLPEEKGLAEPVPEEKPNIPLSSDIAAEKDLDDFVADIGTLDEYIQSYGMGQADMYKKYYLQSTTFIFAYCTLIMNSYQASENFIELFQNVIKSWKPICELHYRQKDINLLLIHYEMAFCLFVQFYKMPAEIVQWCKIHLKKEISSVASTSHEWTHLMCVTSFFLGMFEGDKCGDVPCECHYYIDPATESVNPLNCTMLLQRLRKKLISLKLGTSESQTRSDSVDSKEEGERDQSSGKEEVYVTPPDSSRKTKSIYQSSGKEKVYGTPLDSSRKTKSIYVGDIFSDEDINIYHALVEARVDIRRYHHIAKWKSLVKHILANTY